MCLSTTKAGAAQVHINVKYIFCDLYTNITFSQLQEYHWLGDGSEGGETSSCVPI